MDIASWEIKADEKRLGEGMKKDGSILFLKYFTNNFMFLTCKWNISKMRAVFKVVCINDILEEWRGEDRFV